MFKEAVFDGYEYGIRIAYMDGRLLPVIKNGEIRGFFVSNKEHPWYSRWRFHKSIFDNQEPLDIFVTNIAKAAEWPKERVKTELDSALEQADYVPNAFSWGIVQTIHLISEKEMVVCGSAYHGLLISVMKNMGGQWMKDARGWHVSDTSLAMVVNNLVTQGGYTEEQIMVKDGLYSIVSHALIVAKEGQGVIPYVDFKPELTRQSDEYESGQVFAQVQGITMTGLDHDQIKKQIPRGKTLKHQGEGIRFLASRTGALLADDMGTGKTRTAIISAQIVRATSDRKCVIVAAPKSVLRKWQREILSVYPNEKTAVFDGPSIPDADWIITNYERLDRLYEHADKASVLLVDEAHKLKESSALRTRAAFDLAAKIPFRYMLTATPVLNRESEIHSLLKLTGHPLGELDVKVFTERFSGSREFRNLLNFAISGDWMLRRLQSQVLRGKLPGKTRNYPLVKLSAKQAKQYVQAVNEETHALTRLWNARLILELARIQEAKQYLKAIPRDEKMVIFVERVDSAHLYAEALSTARGGKFVVITGKETDLQRDQAVTAVQEDDSVRGVVGTYGSTAEGIDLWRANHVFFGSQPWTPATQAQSEDRCNRLGQTRKVNVVIPLYEGTLDIDVRELIDSKFEIASDILDPGESERKSIQAVANGIKRRRPEVNGEAAA